MAINHNCVGRKEPAQSFYTDRESDKWRALNSVETEFSCMLPMLNSTRNRVYRYRAV
ncbi:MAG: hypothetical protein UZ06_CHB003002000 [Chlorobi bacterium OLB6]|nr:MAG: hypothetical protein UZ06_CHB003002000 [Chlorobi bacterium OLB6]